MATISLFATNDAGHAAPAAENAAADACNADAPVATASSEPVFSAEQLDALIRENHAALFAYARSLVRDEHVAKDIVQDTYLRLCRTPPEATHAKFWLFRVCRTRAIDWWRSRREQTLPASPDAAQSDATGNASDFFENLPDDVTPAPGARLQSEEDFAEVLRCVERLPARQRELVRLKFQAGLSYKEIAAATGLTVTNVGFILHSAVQTLRDAFAKSALRAAPKL